MKKMDGAAAYLSIDKAGRGCLPETREWYGYQEENSSHVLSEVIQWRTNSFIFCERQ